MILSIQSVVAFGDTDKINIDNAIKDNINMIVEGEILEKNYESVILSNEDEFGQSLVNLEVDISILFSISMDLSYSVEYTYRFGYFVEDNRMTCVVYYLHETPSSANDIEAPFVPPTIAPVENGLVVLQSSVLDYSIDFENKINESDEVKIQFTQTNADLELLDGYEENGQFIFEFETIISADVTSVIYLEEQVETTIPFTFLILIGFCVAVIMIFLKVKMSGNKRR